MGTRTGNSDPDAPPRSRTVQIIGRIPLQGRQGTRALIRLCHDADDSVGLERAWSRLRHAALMNVIRHVLPLPVGVTTTVTYRSLSATHHSAVLVVAAATSTALTLLCAAAAYAQAVIHVRLAAGLRRRATAASIATTVTMSRPGEPASDRPSRGRRHEPEPTYRWDRIVTLAVVALALVTAVPALVIQATQLLDQAITDAPGTVSAPIRAR